LGDHRQVVISPWYVTSQLGQLSLASLWGYAAFAGAKVGNDTSAGLQVTPCDLM